MAIFEIAKNGIWSKKFFVKLIYLISQVFLAWTFFLIFWPIVQNNKLVLLLLPYHLFVSDLVNDLSNIFVLFFFQDVEATSVISFTSSVHSLNNDPNRGEIDTKIECVDSLGKKHALKIYDQFTLDINKQYRIKNCSDFKNKINFLFTMTTKIL